MKSYPSIPKATPVDLPCIVFKKYDGSNIRAEWNPKRGWYKFGTRTRLLDKSDKVFGEAIDIFKNKLGDYIIQQLSNVYKPSKQFYKIDNKLTSVVAFAEFYGKNSMFGKHKENDPKTLTLLDVAVNKKGLMNPYIFADLFKYDDWDHAPAEFAKLNSLNEYWIDWFHTHTDIVYDPYNFCEGVVFKGWDNNQIWMSKLKTKKWLSLLRSFHPEDWEQYE